MAVDKMHMAGHVDSWCKKTCDPHLFTDLNQVSLPRVNVCIHLEVHTFLPSYRYMYVDYTYWHSLRKLRYWLTQKYVSKCFRGYLDMAR